MSVALVDAASVLRDRLAFDERPVVGRAVVDPGGDLRDGVVGKFRPFRRHVRILGVSGEFVEPAGLGVIQLHGRPLGSALEQSLARGEIELALGLFATVTLHAVLQEQ